MMGSLGELESRLFIAVFRVGERVCITERHRGMLTVGVARMFYRAAGTSSLPFPGQLLFHNAYRCIQKIIQFSIIGVSKYPTRKMQFA